MPSRRIVQIVLIVALGCAPSCKRTRDYGRDRADIEQVFNKYLQTLTTLDTSQAAQVWLRSPDVLVVTPVGRLLPAGMASKKNIYIGFRDKEVCGRNVQAANVDVIITGDPPLARLRFCLHGEAGQWRASRNEGGWESHGYQRTAEGWRIAFCTIRFAPGCLRDQILHTPGWAKTHSTPR